MWLLLTTVRGSHSIWCPWICLFPYTSVWGIFSSGIQNQTVRMYILLSAINWETKPAWLLGTQGKGLEIGWELASQLLSKQLPNVSSYKNLPANLCGHKDSWVKAAKINSPLHQFSIPIVTPANLSDWVLITLHNEDINRQCLFMPHPLWRNIFFQFFAHKCAINGVQPQQGAWAELNSSLTKWAWLWPDCLAEITRRKTLFFLNCHQSISNLERKTLNQHHKTS